MNIIISNSSSKPIYEQIIEQLKAQIMEEKLKPGDSIPSIRALAKSTHVSVITVQKAYEQLQRDGFIETIVGKGTFVAKLNKQLYQEEKQRQIEDLLEQAVTIAKSSGISLKKLKELLKFFYEGEI